MVDSPSRSGVFSAGVDQRLAAFSASVQIDSRLYRQDIFGSRVHARMLCRQGLLSDSELQQIETALEEIERLLQAGELPLCDALEDIHMHIEQALIDRCGDTGRKLHTARSRNDQVATDFRLWIREQIDRLDQSLLGLQRAFLGRCKPDQDVILPAYTHLQRAQPVLAAHYWLAYVEKLARDRQRLSDARCRVNISPLGGAAVAGTSLPIDRHWTAEQLGFEGVAANSIDISSDRDFVIEPASVLAMIAVHLSGWAEEWILWATVEFGFLQLPHQFCTGSSIMPQKVNPDTLELIRGKSARVIGALQSLLVLTKGLPLAYNRDLQEDKPPLMDAFDTVQACVELAIPIVEQAQLRRESIAARLDQGYLDATSLMEWLIARGLPQRTAHHLVGSLVGLATQQQVTLSELTDEQLRAAHPSLDPSVRQVLGPSGAVQAYRSFGSSGPEQVQNQILHWERQLQ